MLRFNKKLLIIDDSAIYRRIFEQAAQRLTEVSQVTVVKSGEEALKVLDKQQIDLVLCDMVMPEMDGIETTRAILKKFPGQSIVVVSGISTREAATTLAALSAGALDFIEKPKSGSMQDNMESISESIKKLLLIPTKARASIDGKASTTPSKPASQDNKTPRTPVPKRALIPAYSIGQFNADLVLIGISTGGPNALQKLLPMLPEKFGAPILIVQHMPIGFTEALARQLDGPCSLNVKEAEGGEIAQAGSIYISKGGQHLVVDEKVGPGRFKLSYTDGPPVQSCKPSVDVMFQSVSKLRDLKVVTAILTGMGADGADGVRSIHASRSIKSYTLTQSADSCVVYGMPRAVDEAGLSDESMPLEAIHERLCQMTGSAPLNAHSAA